MAAGTMSYMQGPAHLPSAPTFNPTELPGFGGSVSTADALGGIQTQRNGAFPNSNPYLAFFGMPMRDGKQVVPQNRDHFTWAEAYNQTQLPYMTHYTIRQIMESDMVLCHKVLPLVVSEDRIHIEWHEWFFNDHMLDPRPAESVSRLLSCNFTKGKEVMQTMGRGMEMEFGFYKTPAGQMHFNQQWKQIVNAICMTLEFGAAVALANVRPFTANPGLDRQRAGLSVQQFRALVIRECRLFNCIANKNGLDIAITHADNILISRGAPKSNTVIVPDGTANHLNDPSFNPYFMTGRPLPENRPTDLKYKGKTIYSSRLHNVGGENGPQDPHYRWVTTGTFYRSDASLTFGMDPSEYRTTFRTEQIWNEDNDDYTRITLEEMLWNAGLFHVADDSTRAWELHPKIGTPFFAGCETIGDYYDVQQMTLKLAPDLHCKSAETREMARAHLERTRAAAVPPPEDAHAILDDNAVVEEAARLIPVYGPGDLFADTLYAANGYFDSSAELIEAIRNSPIAKIGTWFQWCLAANVAIPISFLLLNPYQRWHAGTLQALTAGSDLGATFIGHFDVQSGSDYVRKLLGVHFTGKMKSVVLSSRLIANAPNVLVNGYDGGGGTRPWDPNNATHKKNFEYGNIQHNDQFVFAVNRVKPNLWAVDLLGRFNPNIVSDTDPDNELQTGKIDSARRAAHADAQAAAGRRPAAAATAPILISKLPLPTKPAETPDESKEKVKKTAEDAKKTEKENADDLDPDDDMVIDNGEKPLLTGGGPGPEDVSLNQQERQSGGSGPEAASQSSQRENNSLGGALDSVSGGSGGGSGGGGGGGGASRSRRPATSRRDAVRTSLQRYHEAMDKQHFSSAHIYSEFWGFSHYQTGATSTLQGQPKINTLCLPGHQWSVPPETMSHTLVRIAHDHRNEYVYPGSARVRTGLAIGLEKPAYIGAAVSSTISIQP